MQKSIKQRYSSQQKIKYQGEVILANPSLVFHHKHLSLSKQKKDKQIRLQREALELKRREYQQSKKKWQKEVIELERFTLQRKWQHAVMEEEEKKLKIDLFKLAIRKDRINARTDKQITNRYAQIVKQYLNCLPYTAGHQYQSIKFWRSEDRFINLRFVFQLALDRFFGRSPTQKAILNNLSKIVLCKRIKYEEQWIMLSIKQEEGNNLFHCFKSSKSNSSFNPSSNYLGNTNQTYEVCIYSITGKYYQIKKKYTRDELCRWANIITSSSTSQYKIAGNTHRLSVADTLAKLTALKLIQKSSIGEDQAQGLLSSLKTLKQQKPITYFVPTQSEKEYIQQKSQDILSQKISQTEKKMNGQSSDSGQPNTPTQQNFSQGNESEPDTSYDRFKTKKSVRSKSYFYISGKGSGHKLNKPFLSGMQNALFPRNNPLNNIILLPKKQEFYMLQQYVTIDRKKSILDKVIGRVKLKHKIKHELKNCLFYKKQTITVCEQTMMADIDSISLPCFFMIKRKQTAQATEIYITCDSLIAHPFVPGGLQIKTLLTRIIREKQREEVKENHRISNLKTIKNSNRKSRQSKRKSNTKRATKLLQHEKSWFGLRKSNEFDLPFNPEIIERFRQYISNHVISITKKVFLSRQYLKSKILRLIKIQKKVRIFISKQQFIQARSLTRIKLEWLSSVKILLTATSNSSQKKITLYIELVDLPQYQFRLMEYSSIYWDIIVQKMAVMQQYYKQTKLEVRDQERFPSVMQFFLKAVDSSIFQQEERKIKLEKQKPAKYKRMIQTFLFKLSLRLKAKKNIFFIKKIFTKQRAYIILIRRDRQLRSLLQCNLYDSFPSKTKIDSKNSQTAFSKNQREFGSDYGSNKINSRSKHDFQEKGYRYQKIYLMESYFDNIDYRSIADEFYFEKGVFLLKPPKNYNIYYIERLGSLDLNTQQFLREYGVYQRQQNLCRFHQNRISQHLSNKSMKIMLNKNAVNGSQISLGQTQSRQTLVNIRNSGKASRQYKKGEKKTSIQNKQRQVINFLKSNFIRESRQNNMMSKKSFGQSNSAKARQLFEIKSNSHGSIVYYSLYKAQNVFFYLQFYIVIRSAEGQEQLFSIDKFRLFKKQLQESSGNLFYKKLASWAHENEDRFIKTRQASKDKTEDNMSKKDETTSSNLVNLQFFSALIGNNKRLSYDIQKSLIVQKGRNNTLTL